MPIRFSAGRNRFPKRLRTKRSFFFWRQRVSPFGPVPPSYLTTAYWGIKNALTAVISGIVHDFSGTGGPTGANPLTITHTCTGTATNGILLVGITISRYSQNVTGYTCTATYNGVSMTDARSGTTTATELSASSTSSGLVLFYLLNPAVGTNNLTMTWTTPLGAIDSILVTRSSYTGVSGINGVTTTTSNGATNSPTLAITSQTGDLAFTAASHGDTISGSGVGTNQRAILNFSASAAGDNIVCGDEAGAATVNMDFTSAVNDQWVMIGLNMVKA